MNSSLVHRSFRVPAPRTSERSTLQPGAVGFHPIITALFLVLFLTPLSVRADVFSWNTNKNEVTVDLKSTELFPLLKRIAASTQWQVFVEPETLHTVSAKFKNVPPGEALRLLLGDVNYALLPGSNSPSKLYVFRTSAQNATQRVKGGKVRNGERIANELVIRLKPGAKIEDVARALGAKVVGRIDRLNAYRLQFEDAAAADAAREQLAANPGVGAVDNNYAVLPPDAPGSGPSGSAPLQLQLKPPPDSGKIIVGLVDTAVQPLGNGLDQFLLKQISVVGNSPNPGNEPTHGTAMAETMLRSLQDITQGSTSVQILPVNVYSDPGVGGEANTTSFDVANGIIAAVNGGARIINLSLGSPSDSAFLSSVIQEVLRLNIPVFAAAGNEPVTTPFYPAAYPGVQAVTAIDQGQLAPYANRGSFITLGAPGTSIIPYGNISYDVQGTSVSSAFTSGMAAGYMDTHGANTIQTLSFVNNNFGIRITPKGP